MVLDEPLKPVMKKPEIELSLTQKAPEIAEELQPLASEKINKLPDVQNEIASLDKPEQILIPNKIPKPEINLPQSLESATKSIDAQDIVKDNNKASADKMASSLRPKSRPRYIQEPNFENKSESQVIDGYL